MPFISQRILRAAEVDEHDSDISFTRLRQTIRKAYEDLMDELPPPGDTIPDLLRAMERELGLH